MLNASNATIPNSDHQHRKRYGIVIEPMPTLCTHDAALTLQTPAT